MIIYRYLKWIEYYETLYNHKEDDDMDVLNTQIMNNIHF